MIAPDLSISTPLVEFFENVYKPRRVESSRNWICVVKRSIRILADMLGRVAVVGDLTPDTVAALRERLNDSVQDWRNHNRHAKAVRSMMYMAQSLLADLRPNPSSLPAPTASMPLSEFVDAYYTSRCRAVLSKSWRWHLHRGVHRPFDYHATKSALYARYGKLLEKAGLPNGRKYKFHCFRKSVASFLQAAGVNASESLGHSSVAITKKSYLDPRIVKAPSPSEVLFRPMGVAATNTKPATGVTQSAALPRTNGKAGAA